MKLYGKQTIRKLTEDFDFQCTKSLGQNFLLDKNIVDKIVKSAQLTEADTVIEVGPGMGVLTQELARIAKKVIAVEIDGRLIPILEKTLKDYDNVTIVHQDILKVNLNNLIDNEGYGCNPCGKICFVANLPYYITSAIIMKVLEQEIPFQSMTVMMQKEVALRIMAKPGTKDYGALTVMVQYYCQAVSVTNVAKEVFFPVPKVDSTVLQLVRRQQPSVPVANKKLFFQTVKQGFAQRRKTLGNTMAGFQGFSKEDMKNLLLRCRIDPQRRGETLSIEEFALLAHTIDREKGMNQI